MKRVRQGLLVVVVVGLGILATTRSYAQEPPPLPTQPAFRTATPVPFSTPTATPVVNPENVVEFSQLGITEPILLGPFDSTSLDFGLPAEWELTEGARVELVVTPLLGPSARTSDETPLSECLLDSSLDDVALQPVLLNGSHEQTISIPVSPAVLATPGADGRHRLRVALNGSLSCDFSQQIGVIIHPTSRLVLPHRIVPPPTDLALLPRPIYQGSFMSDAAVLVVPDRPLASDLQAAFAVAAGFGRMSGGQLALTLTTAGRLTPEMRSSTHLIFVGGAAAFPMLRDVALPVAISGSTSPPPSPNSGGKGGEAAPEDGIVQLAVSPWNSTRVVLVVSGGTPAGVIKAGQAVSSGVIPTGSQPNLALVVNVQSRPTETSVSVDRTFTDLGYSVETVRRVGTSVLEYRFYVPPGQTVGGDAYIGLRFNHTAALDYDRSVMVVSLNGAPIGSARLSDQTTKPGDARFPIPRSALRSGNNRLVVQATLVPPDGTFNPQGEGPWLTVWPESLLHLPLSASQRAGAHTLDLKSYPESFVRRSTLSNLAFVVASDDPAGWNVAAQLAADLGRATDATLAEFAVFYADASPAILRSYDLLVVGRPSSLQLISELRDALPAPFDPGSDLPTEWNTPVVFRIRPDTSIGYLQILAAPWNGERAILAVLGSTDQGVQWAGRALTVPELRGQLAGNFALVSDGRIVTNVGGTGGNAVQTPGATGEARSSGPSTALERPQWILIALGISVLMIVGIAVAVAISTVRRRPAH